MFVNFSVIIQIVSEKKAKLFYFLVCQERNIAHNVQPNRQKK